MKVIKEKIGKAYGFWTILSFHRIDSHGDARWWCKCNLCENTYSVRGYTLRNGQSTKCFSCARRMRSDGL